METTYAYLAGMIDIHGVVSIARRTSQRRDGQMGYCVRVALSDTSPVVPDLLYSLFPSSSLSHAQPRKASYSRFWLWEAEHNQAREPLLRLLPHLRLKRRQAELALALMGLAEKQNAGRSLSKPLSAEQHAMRHHLYEEVARLNSERGPRNVVCRRSRSDSMGGNNCSRASCER
jgi:hypothetical protein